MSSQSYGTLEPCVDAKPTLSYPQASSSLALSLCDSRNPYHHKSRGSSPSKRWCMLFLVAAFASADAMAAMILYPALPSLASTFQSTSTHAVLACTLPRIARAFFPLYWAPLSERYGRRPTIMISVMFTIVFCCLSATSMSMNALIAMQILATAASSASTPLGAAVVAESWEASTRGTAFGILYLGPLVGAAVAPVVGGVLVENWGWQATQLFLAAWVSCCLIGMVLGLSETRIIEILQTSSVLPNHEAAATPRSSWWLHSFTKAFGPFKVFRYLGVRSIALNVCLASITFGVMGALGISIQTTFGHDGYAFSPSMVGLTYLPMALGLILASVVGGRWTDHVMQSNAKQDGRIDEDGQGVSFPGDRIGSNAWFAVTLVPSALLAYGWTTALGLQWSIPLIATFLVGFGAMLIFGFVNPMLAEQVPNKAASLLAMNGVGRNMCNGMAGTAAIPLASLIGNGWLFTGVAAVASLNMLAVVALKETRSVPTVGDRSG